MAAAASQAVKSAISTERTSAERRVWRRNEKIVPVVHRSLRPAEQVGIAAHAKTRAV
jgi:hypothetical protein